MAAPSPTPTPTVTPTPTPPPLVPVTGVVASAATDGTNPERLGLSGNTDVDPAAVEAAATRLAGALDTYLDLVQSDSADLGVLDGGWLETSAPEVAEALRTLADRWNPVGTATYDMLFEIEDGPALATVNLIVTRLDGSVARAQLLFDVTTEAPVLLLADTGATP